MLIFLDSIFFMDNLEVDLFICNQKDKNKKDLQMKRIFYKLLYANKGKNKESNKSV